MEAVAAVDVVLGDCAEVLEIIDSVYGERRGNVFIEDAQATYQWILPLHECAAVDFGKRLGPPEPSSQQHCLEAQMRHSLVENGQ